MCRDAWQATLESSLAAITASSPRSRRHLREVDVIAHNKSLEEVTTAEQKKWMTLGMAGGDLLRNYNAASIYFVRGSKVGTSAVNIAWAIQRIQMPTWRCHRIKAASKVYVPLSRIETPGPGLHPAMTMCWVGIEDNTGRFSGTIYCHSSLFVVEAQGLGIRQRDPCCGRTRTRFSALCGLPLIEKLISDHAASLGSAVGNGDCVPGHI